tara:strand:+ start:666 stop:890 length:225 start_codon:yes stop_codon:yes gene_type:complete
MKNKLTTEQKINEFIGKALANFLTKRASKALAKSMKNDPELTRLMGDLDKVSGKIKDKLQKKFGTTDTKKILDF